MSNVDYTRFDFHALRFLKSEAIEVMTAEEVGQFVLLMCHAWLGGKGASLPNNPKLLARYARCEEISEAVLAMWSEGEDGRLYNDTLSEEWAAVSERSGHGKRGADARWNKGKSASNARDYAPAMPEHCPTNGQAVSNQIKSNQARPDQSGAYAPKAAAVPQNDSTASPDGSEIAAVKVAEHLLVKFGPTEETLDSSVNQIRSLFGIDWVSPEGKAKTAAQIEKILTGIIDFAFSTEFWPQFITTTESFVKAVLKKAEPNSLPQQWRGSLRKKSKSKNSVIEGVSSLNVRNARPPVQVNPGWDEYKQKLQQEKEN
jgi:uncharacterized protein YdaU (DUF1376 family)